MTDIDYDRWLESPYTDVDDIECDECEDCTDECTTHEGDNTADEEPDYILRNDE